MAKRSKLRVRRFLPEASQQSHGRRVCEFDPAETIVIALKYRGSLEWVQKTYYETGNILVIVEEE